MLTRSLIESRDESIPTSVSRMTSSYPSRSSQDTPLLLMSPAESTTDSSSNPATVSSSSSDHLLFSSQSGSGRQANSTITSSPSARSDHQLSNSSSTISPALPNADNAFHLQPPKKEYVHLCNLFSYEMIFFPILLFLTF